MAKQLRSAMAKLQLSPRAFHRILKLTRTIADQAESQAVGGGNTDKGSAEEQSCDE